MFKNIIGPMQAWLLSQGKCVGCGKKLSEGTGTEAVRIVCNCGRVYMLDPVSRKYRRATLNEAR